MLLLSRRTDQEGQGGSGPVQENLAEPQLPEAQHRSRLAQFLSNLLLQFMEGRVQRDRQSQSVRVVDLHHHGVPLCCLGPTRTLATRRGAEGQTRGCMGAGSIYHCSGEYYLAAGRHSWVPGAPWGCFGGRGVGRGRGF